MNEIQEQTGQSGALRGQELLEGAILSFDLNREIKRLREENAWQAGRNSKTLVKHPDLRLVLTVLQSGTRVREHKSAGRISVQVVAGHIQIHVQDQICDLPSGQLLVLDRAIPHDVEALEDSAFLLTIAWPESADKS